MEGQFEVRLDAPFYTDEHREWRDSLRRFIDDRLMPHVNQWDEAGEVPRAVHREVAEFGLTRLGFPEEFGGFSEGTDIFHFVIKAQELARMGAGGVATALSTHDIGLPPLIVAGSEEIKRRVAPPVLSGEKIIALAITEPGAGSDVAALRTRARREGEFFRVDGSKTFISGGMNADFVTAVVRTGADGARGLSLLLIERGMPGFSATRLPKQGWWASDTATLHFDNVAVPAANLIGAEGAGFALIMNNLNRERLMMAAGAIGAARACLQDAAEWARERETFGKRLVEHQVIRHKLVEMSRRIEAGQAYLERTAARMQQGERCAADIAMLKVDATLTMEFCAREASQVLGGASYIRGCRVERIYREVRVNAIGGGSEEILRDLAARQLGFDAA
jgi:acyl-CoA dehydrogenase